MQFDHTHKPNRDNLSPATATMMDRVFYRRRAEGLNVQFIGASGDLDEWSFNNAERRDAFVATLAKHGKAYAAAEA
ncbi:hypothetical protein OEG84_11530 [Hoeflea sp. G2-23]|uniref:Uncharacterized protein n=1 Tax=Hoeflea algicola TaxID=2983763 RepID=A0ABT3ZAG0_9HYPH|nr:hypothetical protein [Hoeflea algicola]MCY0148324.1 hypothetical protein [Hoeflea algicola]